MRQGIQLPDYLPSHYKTWYDLYLDILRWAESESVKLTDDTIINLGEFGFEESQLKELYQNTYFYQEWPLIVIKSRALDAVVSQMPTFKELLDFKKQIPFTEVTHKFVSRLLMLCAKK